MEFGRTFQVVYCYETLHHLSKPAIALEYMQSSVLELSWLRLACHSPKIWSRNRWAVPRRCIQPTGGDRGRVDIFGVAPLFSAFIHTAFTAGPSRVPAKLEHRRWNVVDSGSVCGIARGIEQPVSH